MMGIAWTPELSVGVEETDNQHKEIYRNVDHFFGQIKKGNQTGNLADLFSYLETYVATHFLLEEKYMAKFHTGDGCGYEDEKEHKAQHRAFLRDFTAFQEEILENGPTLQLVAEFQKWIVNWLGGHLGKTDKGLGRFLRSDLPFLKRS